MQQKWAKNPVFNAQQQHTQAQAQAHVQAQTQSQSSEHGIASRAQMRRLKGRAHSHDANFYHSQHGMHHHSSKYGAQQGIQAPQKTQGLGTYNNNSNSKECLNIAGAVHAVHTHTHNNTTNNNQTTAGYSAMTTTIDHNNHQMQANQNIAHLPRPYYGHQHQQNQHQQPQQQQQQQTSSQMMNVSTTQEMRRRQSRPMRSRPLDNEMIAHHSHAGTNNNNNMKSPEFAQHPGYTASTVVAAAGTSAHNNIPQAPPAAKMYAATPNISQYLPRNGANHPYCAPKNASNSNRNCPPSSANSNNNNNNNNGSGSGNGSVSGAAVAGESRGEIASKMKKITYKLNGEKFVLYEYLRPTKFLGKGAYAVVISATDLRTGSEIAIKKNKGVFNALSDAKRILREIKLMQHFNHENVMSLLNVIPPDIHERETFDEVYLLMPKMETTLSRVIRSRQTLTERHKQYFIFQLLRGLKYIHSAGVIHRDLKPENILINGSDCKLRITDFGLSRGVLKDGSEPQALTEYVVTRWYRAPEIMCSSRQYDEGVDVWGVGCIMSELYLRTPIFPGNNHIEQLKIIFYYLGTPVDCEWIKTPDARRWVHGLEQHSGQDFAKVFPTATKHGCDLIHRMLCKNPKKRITVQQALEHPWMNQLYRTAIASIKKTKTRKLKSANLLKNHVVTDEEIEAEMDVCQEKFNLQFEFEKQINTLFGVRHMMYEELRSFINKKKKKKVRRTTRKITTAAVSHRMRSSNDTHHSSCSANVIGVQSPKYATSNV